LMGSPPVTMDSTTGKDPMLPATTVPPTSETHPEVPVMPVGAVPVPGSGTTPDATPPVDPATPVDPDAEQDVVVLTLQAGGPGVFGRVSSLPPDSFTCTVPPCSASFPRGTNLVLRAQTTYDGVSRPPAAALPGISCVAISAGRLSSDELSQIDWLAPPGASS
jgi:hypothetical protein